MKQATAYIRVSDINKQDGHSQREAILQYADKNQITITSWVEEHVSASKDGVNSREIASLVGRNIIMTDITRLGRKGVMAMIGLIAAIAESGELHLAYSDKKITKENLDDAETIFSVVGQSYSAAEEAKKRSARAIAGHQRRKAQGLSSGRKVGAVIKSKLDPHAALILNELAKKTPKTRIVSMIQAAGTNCTRKGLHDWINKRTINKKDSK